MSEIRGQQWSRPASILRSSTNAGHGPDDIRSLAASACASSAASEATQDQTVIPGLAPASPLRPNEVWPLRFRYLSLEG